MLQKQEISEGSISAKQLRVIYSSQRVAATTALHASVGPLLEVCLAQTNSLGAYVYRINGEDGVLELVAWRGSRPTDIPSYSVLLEPRIANWFLERTDNVALDKSAWQDWRFQNLPEFVQNRYESAVSIPVLEEGKLSGIANFCQLPPAKYGVSDIAFLAGLSLPLGSVLAKTRLESEIADLSRKLADRKLLDRAKGILQSRFGWTEEEAYYHMRRTSRQSRAPMRSVARHVIQNAVLPSPWQEDHLRD